MITKTFDPAKYKLVPIEPSVEMTNCGAPHLTGLTSYAYPITNRIFAAMLAAAPEVPDSEPKTFVQERAQLEQEWCGLQQMKRMYAELVNKQLLDALQFAECMYRRNVAVAGEPSSVLEAMQKAIAAVETKKVNDCDLEQALRERDEYHDMADQLADQIAAITDVDIGEHSSANEPWRNALIAADEYLAKNFDPTMYAAFLKGKLAAAEAKRGAK